MDGDSAPIAELIALRRRHPSVMLYVDEAHAFGVLGPQGLGLCMATADSSEIDVIVGTFGKACCSMGAFAALSPTLREYAVNRPRSFIFSTALDDGFKVLPIRTPTVPPGTDRLRISLSAALSMQDIEGFARALKNKTARCSSN